MKTPSKYYIIPLIVILLSVWGTICVEATTKTYIIFLPLIVRKYSLPVPTVTPTATPTTGTIHGVVWDDLNRDGVYSGAEPPLAEAQIRLKDSSHAVIGFWVTQASGAYVFTNLSPSVYYVSETDPPGYGSITVGEVGLCLSANQSVVFNFGDYALPISAPTPNHLKGERL